MSASARSNGTRDDYEKHTSYSSKMTLFVGVMMLMCIPIVASTPVQYVVGDDKGWTVNINYTDWALSHTFQEGDIVVFQYPPGEHDVLRVNANDYEMCGVSNPAETDSSGQSAFELKYGENYFICGFPKHCMLSQRIFINAGAVPAVNANGSATFPYGNNAIGADASAPGPAGPLPSSTHALSVPVVLSLSPMHVIILIFSCFRVYLES